MGPFKNKNNSLVFLKAFKNKKFLNKISHCGLELKSLAFKRGSKLIGRPAVCIKDTIKDKVLSKSYKNFDLFFPTTCQKKAPEVILNFENKPKQVSSIYRNKITKKPVAHYLAKPFLQKNKNAEILVSSIHHNTSKYELNADCLKKNSENELM